MTGKHTITSLDLSYSTKPIADSVGETTPSYDELANLTCFRTCSGAPGESVTSPVSRDAMHPLLYERSVEGQLYRRGLLRGSTIVFFCAGYPSKKFIYELAAKCGIKSIIVDDHDSWAKGLVVEGVISAFVGVDMSQEVNNVYVEALVALRSLGRQIDGVCTFVELSVGISARLNQALGLVGAHPDLVDIARDKSETRAVLEAKGLPNVKNTMIYSESDLDDAAAKIGFPAVLKPVSGAASLGVQKVNSKEEFVKVYNEVSEILNGLIVASGALERKVTNSSGDENGHDAVHAASVINCTVLMEEYLDGPEVDVDVVMSNGECQYATVIDNGPTSEPYFGETWAALPSLLPLDHVAELRDLAIASVKGIGFTDGVYHVELKYTSRGPRLIEVNARMGGGPTRMIHKLVFGIDLVIEQFLIAIGVPSRPLIPSTPLTHIAYSFINARSSGSVASVAFIQEHAKRDNVVWVLTYVKNGEKVVGPEDGHPTWLGDVVVQHPDGHEALRIVKEIENEIATEFHNRRI